MQYKILAIDDDEKILRLIQNVLEGQGYLVTTRSQIDDINLCEFTGYDLILLDIMMPGVDGIDICTAIRSQIDCPILFLTAKNLEEDLVQGIAAGADDYITKPFGIKELVARVQMHIRRDQRHEGQKEYQDLGDLQFHKQSQTVLYQSQEITLTKREFDLLYLLARNPHKVFTADELYEYLYPQDSDTLARSITEYIYQIRQKCKPYGVNPIKTIWGGGYSWKEK